MARRAPSKTSTSPNLGRLHLPNSRDILPTATAANSQRITHRLHQRLIARPPLVDVREAERPFPILVAPLSPQLRPCLPARRIEDLTAPKEEPASPKTEEPKHEEPAAEHPVPSIKPGKPGEPLTMSSREIAELLGARHDNVRVTVERLANRGVIELPAMQEVVNHLGQKVREYHLDKRSSLIVVAQLSPEFTARVVDRWQELEERVATYQKAISTFDEAEILRMVGGVVKAVTERQTCRVLLCYCCLWRG